MQFSWRVRRHIGLAVALAGLGSVGAQAQPDVQPRAVVLIDLDGRSVRPLASRAQASVFVFTRSDCPIAARYAPELERLQRRMAAASIDFHLVFVDPDEPVAATRAYLRDYGYTGRALRDPTHALVRLTGVTTTPEAAVFVPGQDGPALVYRGRIDNRYVDIGRVRAAPTTHDLDEVIEAVRARRNPGFHSTPAVGCLIADLGR
jgi:Redoxin